jgi:hypothetical protein
MKTISTWILVRLSQALDGMLEDGILLVFLSRHVKEDSL